ncbi:MAG: hypothetical protein EON90_00850 [Brevundimonas sp.]|nr:MAG: hypothetical protein EON90_00850 [Brevundimonas sp.]
MRTLLISLILLLAGCASVPSNAPAYSRAAEPPPGLSNVYIYRLGAYPILRAPTISIDRRAVISPAERAYTVVTLPPGSHEVQVNWPWDTGWPDLTFKIDVEPNTPLYLKVSGSFTHLGSVYPAGLSYEAGSSVHRLPQAVAEPEMTVCCRYVRPIDNR